MPSSPSIPQPGYDVELAQDIRTLNNLLTTKLHGDHLLFPSEQALNERIRALVCSLRTRRIYPASTLLGYDFGLPFRVYIWLLESMVSMWKDDRALGAGEAVELVKLRHELEKMEGWRKSVSGAWMEDGLEGNMSWE